MNLRPFEIALIGIFGAFAIGGLIFFSVYRQAPSTADKPYGDQVIIWGTLNRNAMTEIFNTISNRDKAFQVVKYVQKNENSFDSDLITAIAQGQSPDMIILPSTSIVSLRKVVAPITYASYSERTFKDTYIDGASIFALGDGIYGLPFAVDPLVMYWNRDMFSTAGLTTPPRTWESLVSQTTPALTKTNQTINITQSAIAFGAYENVSHAKEILAMLFLQAGSSIVEEKEDRYTLTLNRSIANGLPPGAAVLSFYTQFANPSVQAYSWNRSLTLDRTQFVSGTLGLYFGMGSEYVSMQHENPNLNFDLSAVPQGSGATTYRDYGTFYSFAILRASTNKTGAYTAAQVLAGDAASKVLAESFDFVPVSRAVIATGDSDANRTILYQAALIARGWLDPRSKQSGNIFSTMVEAVTSGRKQENQAVEDSVKQLQSLYK